ncbi:MAG: small basic protein [Candidatus Omnitrophica bacterium]|nr:small basic protein [Candidatus Omnitrophota bacterium]
MSVHTSLRSSGATDTARSVLKRHERVRRLMEQGKWQAGDSVLGLPKLKQIKVRIRKAAAAKEKTEGTAEAAATEGAAPAAGAGTASAKPSAAKPAATKSAGKPA